ncbi:hypothetical protein V5799_018897, partial [Amblyomma americanum]
MDQPVNSSTGSQGKPPAAPPPPQAGAAKPLGPPQNGGSKTWATVVKQHSQPDPGPCFGYFPRYYFDKENRTCQQFIYGGCQGNGNNFETKELCEYSCDPKTDYQKQCLSRPETGPCRAHMVLWAFDIVKGHCEQFVYGGCDGTDNKYLTKEMCEKNCNRPQ